MLQPHFISCRGVSGGGGGGGGQEATCRIQEFLSVLFSPQLILQFKVGFHLLLRKLYLYFTKDPELFSGGGGVSNLFPEGGGVQMLISIETHISTCYFPG